MEVGLGWLGLGIGLAGSAAAAALAGRSSEELDEAARRATAWNAAVTALLTVLLWAIAMQRGEPFSAGQSLGWGFLIGGLSAAAAALSLVRFASTRLASAGYASFGLFGVSLAYLIFRGDPQPAMLGFAAGVLMGTVLTACQKDARRESLVFGAFCVLLALALVFSVNHFNAVSLRPWWPLPLLIGATICLGAFAGALLTASSAAGSLISAGILLALAAIYAAKVFASWGVLWTAAAGIATAALAAWAAASACRAKDDDELERAGAVSAVLAVAFVVAAFKLWAGLGIALGLSAVFAVLLPAMAREAKDSPAASALRGMVLFGLSVVLFRLFIELYKPELGGTDPRVHYTFIGAVLGVLMPRVLSAAGVRNSGRPWLQTGAAGLTGLAAAAFPIVLLLVWEIKAVLGMTLGATIAAALIFAESTKNAERGASRTGEVVLALAAQLSAVVFVRPLMEIDLTRTHRAIMLAVVVAAAVAWMLVSGALSRRSSD